eukprot:2719372-Prymnesium_polylepis.1
MRSLGRAIRLQPRHVEAYSVRAPARRQSPCARRFAHVSRPAEGGESPRPASPLHARRGRGWQRAKEGSSRESSRRAANSRAGRRSRDLPATSFSRTAR